MPASQIFVSAYQINGTPTNGATINLSNRTSANVTVTDTSNGTGDNTAILGDVGTPASGPTLGDAMDVQGLNNGTAYYWGTATVGNVTGIVIYDPQGKNYHFLSNATTTQFNSNTTVTPAISTNTSTTNDWALAGNTTPDAPVITSITDNAQSPTESVAANASTNDSTPTINGTAGAALTISVYGNGTLLGTTTSAADGTWSYTPTARTDGSHSFTATATNPALTTGATSAPSSAFTTSVDTTASTVSGVAYGANDGALAAGEPVTLLVTFTENVFVAGGNPTLGLSNGATATYTGGTGTNTLTFTYTPAAGQSSSSDLAVTGFNLPAGATVRDAAGNNVNAAGAVANPAGTLAVDTGAPTVSSVAYGTNDGTLAAGEATTLTVTFSESVTVAGTPTLSLNSGGTATYTGGSGTGTLTFTYTPAAGQSASDLAVTAFNLPSGATVKDAAGNNANTAGAVANPAGTLAVDTAAPSATGVSFGANDGALAAGESVTLNVAFSEAVTVAGGTPTLTLNTGGTATYAGGSGSGTLAFTYTPAAGQSASDIQVTAFNLNGATVKDAAGNNAGTAGAVGDPAGTVAVDTTASTVSGVAYGANDGAVAAGEPVTLTVTFTESVFVAGGSPTLALNSGGTATYTGGTGTNTLTFTYTPAAGQSASDLAITGFNLPTGVTVRDAAGNNVSAAGAAANPAGTLAVDTAAPSITAAAAPSGTFGIGQEVSFTLTGSEALTVTGTPTLTLSNGATATYASGSGTGSLVFKYTVAAGQTDSGDVNVTGINGTIKDAAGNSVQAFSVGTAGTTAVDANAPAATTTVALVQDTGTPGDGISAIPALSGVATGHQPGDTITIRDNGVVVGTAAIGANGVWTFANAGAAGSGHSYTAAVTDGAGNSGTATATSPASTSVNDGGDDDLTTLATSGADLVVGGDGSDTVVGLDGDDTLWGDDAAGDPAGDGGDAIDAGAGDDSVVGGGGDDTVDGGDGEDTLLGGAGGDTLAGDGGADSLDGGDGADYLIGGGAADTVQGGAGDDTIRGDGADDAGDVVDGGDGRDEFSYYGADGVTIDLAAGTTSSGATLVNIEDAWGDAGDDLIRGDAGDNRLRGWSGDDTLEGGGGADTLEGEAGNDSVLGGDGDDVVVLGDGGDDTVNGGDGEDTVVFAGRKADYTITSATDAGGQHFLVTDTAGGRGTAKVYGAEFLEFADQTDPVCFMPGTLVATPSGERAVETLAAGDLVLTAGGGAKPVRWLGRQTVSTRFADPLRVLPVRIAAGALGEGLPKRDLLVSPDHALLVDGVLVQAGALVDGAAVRREHRVPEVFTYWHVELADHSLVLAEGVAAETFVDNVARMAFDNWAEHDAAADAPAPLAEMALPRAKAARQVPRATRERLAARAALLLGKQAAAAA